MHIKNNSILDDENRVLILRGVNLGGDSKIPYGPAGSEIEPAFLDRQNKVSFVGRPFPLEEAEKRFEQLKKAGMTFLRLIVTWEAIEHEGPGIYDEEYLAYLRKILLAAEQNEISVFIDPHQDVWSRWTGGDGAPAWTMEKLGMDLSLMDKSGAAVTRQRYSLFHKSKKYPDGDPYPKMLWPGNYNLYAAATMFSLFYGGAAFAPEFNVDGENVQDWLQNRYIAAFMHAQRRLKNCATIKGWGVMNEPHAGFIGHQHLNVSENPVIPMGPRPSPWQAICAANGYCVKVPVYSMTLFGVRVTRYDTVNPEGVTLFKKGHSCPWKQAGVWTDEGGAPRLLRENYFNQYLNRNVVFTDDFLKPFSIKYINAMKAADEKTFFFIEGLPDALKAEAHQTWKSKDPPNTINAFHLYDGLSLFTKSFRPWFNISIETKKLLLGRKKVSEYFSESLAKVISITKQKMNNMPVLLGEFGLAFDMNKRKAFKTGDYSVHEEALSMYYDAVDANMLNSTIWNYSFSNTNQYGDGWNDEDLSIFSEGKERVTAGWKRPYPMACAGKPLSFRWNKKRKEFFFHLDAYSGIKAPSVIFLPEETFGPTPKIETLTSTGKTMRWEHNAEEQKLHVYNDGYSGEAVIKVLPS